mgnify:CR=1 FL=1|tara:strand:+ start:636 stop:3833 length:3198 start_codon:yes stop_codon:yes gene_type:complete
MATSFNLQEYILFRTEIKRELTNAEVDTNFQMVSNPWESTRVYEIGNIIYHPVIVDDPATTGEDQVLVWWRANSRTTQGTFITKEWDIIGGIGSGTLNVVGADSFGKININSTTPTGALQTTNDGLIVSANPNDTFNFIAGAGMELQYNIASRSLKLVNTLASNPGEVNVGENIGSGIGHQDVYAGKVGVNLQFMGFQSTNTSNVAGNALTISTDSINNNIEYNFNESNVNLAALNSGAPTINMLSDVSSAAVNNLDILQYSTSSGLWTPTTLASLGQVNIYNQDGAIASANRIVSLASSAGNLQFNQSDNSGINITNSAVTHQMEIKSIGSSDAAFILSNDGTVQLTIGVDQTDASYGISHGAIGLGGLTVDGFSLSNNNEIYVPQLGADTITTIESFRIPLVDIGVANKGRFDSTSSYRASSYSDQGGTIDMISILHEGDYTFKGVSNINAVSATSFSFDNEHDFAANTNLTDGYGILMSYKTPTNKEADTIINHMDKTNRRFVGFNFAAVNSTMPIGSTVNKYLGSNITLDDMAASATPDINVGSIINFSDTTAGAGAQPQRVGVYSNVVTSYTGAGSQDGEQVLTELISNAGSWAGYFVGCVNIDQGGLTLPATTLAARPLCNGGTNDERTLWINSADGHLYRGTVDVEASGGSSTLGGLTDVTLTGLVDDQLLVYNSSTSLWENASLAAYNLNAISLTNGGVSIALTDGSASSDVDLLPGTNITFTVNEVTDEITINSAGGGGGVGPQGPQGPQGPSSGVGTYSNAVPTPQNFPSDASPNVPTGSTFTNQTFEQMMNLILYPTLYPSFSNPSLQSVTLNPGNSFQIIGKQIAIGSLTLSCTFNQGTINPQYTAATNKRSGLPNQYNYTSSASAFATTVVSTALSNTVDNTAVYTVTASTNSFSVSVNYDIGPQPKDSKGVDYDNPLPAGNNPPGSTSRSFTGVYQVFYTENNYLVTDGANLQNMGNTDVFVTMFAEDGVAGNKQAIAIPNTASGQAGFTAFTDVYQEDPLNVGQYIPITGGLSTFTLTTENRTVEGNTVTYNLYTHNGATIGSRKLKFIN